MVALTGAPRVPGAPEGPAGPDSPYKRTEETSSATRQSTYSLCQTLCLKS